MADARDPSALMRHAIQAGDWKLVELIARRLCGQPGVPTRAGFRAYQSLCLRLGLVERQDYHRG